MYLTAVIDWYSRYVLSWRLSNTLDGAVLPGGVGRGVVAGQAGDLQHRSGVAVHVAGVHRPVGGGRGRGEPGRSGAGVGQRVRGAALEECEIRGYLSSKTMNRVPELETGLTAYFRFYDEDRPHQSLDYRTPARSID